MTAQGGWGHANFLFKTPGKMKPVVETATFRDLRHGINSDVYPMQAEESHIGMALLDAGKQLINLHVADSNRCALGQGSLDLDAMIMALHCIGHNSAGHFTTPEPLGPGATPIRR